MFLHKYIVGSNKIFVLSPESSPSGQIILKQNNWQGRAVSGNYNRLINWIEESDKEIGYSKKPGSKHEEEEVENKGKKACLSYLLRGFVDILKE